MPAENSAIDWAASYGCTWRVSVVDAATWASSSALDGAHGGSVKRTADGALLESGSVDLGGADVPSGEFWGRIEMLADDGVHVERHAVATLLFEPSGSTRRRGWADTAVDGRSVLAPAADMAVPDGSYAPAGSDGAQRAARLLRACTPAPVSVEGGFELASAVVFDPGASYLDAAWQVLDAAGWCIQLDGSGRVTVREMPASPALVLDTSGARLLSTSVEVDDGLSGAPNRYIAVADGVTATAADMDPSRRTSYPARGRWVDEYDKSAKPASGETLQAYAERKLAEALGAATRSYTRAWVPGVTVYDVVRGNLPGAGLSGDMRVTSQSLSLGKGIDVDEECGAIA